MCASAEDPQLMERVIVTACPGSSETLWLVSLSPPSLTAVTEYVPGATDTCTLSFCLELSCREREITHTLTTVSFTPGSRQKRELHMYVHSQCKKR